MQAPIVEITMPEDDRWHPGEKFGLGADGKILCYSEERKKWRKSIYGHGEDFADGMGPVQRLVVALVEQLRQSKEESADLKRSRGMIDADAEQLARQRDALADELEEWTGAWPERLEDEGVSEPYAGWYFRSADDHVRTKVYVSPGQWSKVQRSREALRKAGRL